LCFFSYFVLPFVLLRQKGGVFFYLDRNYIFNRSSDFCPKMAKGGVCWFVIGCILLDKKHFYVIMLIKHGCCYIQSLHISYMLQEDSVQNSRHCCSKSLPSVRTSWYSIRTLICQASSVRTTRTFRPDLPSMFKSFKLFSIASVKTSQQHVRMPFSV